jgi:hypothetical protein
MSTGLCRETIRTDGGHESIAVEPSHCDWLLIHFAFRRFCPPCCQDGSFTRLLVYRLRGLRNRLRNAPPNFHPSSLPPVLALPFLLLLLLRARANNHVVRSKILQDGLWAVRWVQGTSWFGLCTGRTCAGELRARTWLLHMGGQLQGGSCLATRG